MCCDDQLNSQGLADIKLKQPYHSLIANLSQLSINFTVLNCYSKRSWTRFLFPFGRITLKSALPIGYVENPVTMGEHLKKARLTRGLLQKEVGEIMGISHFTYLWWERDAYLPRDPQWKEVIEFLGYYPILGPFHDINPFQAKRRHLGLSKKAFAKLLCVDEQTYARIESDKKPGGRKYSHEELIAKIKSF